MREDPSALERGWFREISTLEKLGNHYFSSWIASNSSSNCLDLASLVIGWPGAALEKDAGVEYEVRQGKNIKYNWWKELGVIQGKDSSSKVTLQREKKKKSWFGAGTEESLPPVHSQQLVSVSTSVHLCACVSRAGWMHVGGSCNLSKSKGGRGRGERRLTLLPVPWDDYCLFSHLWFYLT